MPRTDRGFTLVELMVVVGIIATLMAIAIPVFLGARRRGQDRAAQTSLRNGLAVAKSLATNVEGYTASVVTALANDEPAFTFVEAPTPSSGPTVISVNAVSVSQWVATVLSRSGTCFAIRDVTVSPGGTTYASSGAGACESSQAWATGASDPTW